MTAGICVWSCFADAAPNNPLNSLQRMMSSKKPEKEQTSRLHVGYVVTRLTRSLRFRRDPSTYNNFFDVQDPWAPDKEDLWQRSFLVSNDLSSLFPKKLLDTPFLPSKQQEIWDTNPLGLTITQIVCIERHPFEAGSWESDKQFKQTRLQSQALNKLRRAKVRRETDCADAVQIKVSQAVGEDGLPIYSDLGHLTFRYVLPPNKFQRTEGTV